jgi:predicted DNA-binding antitoxin AbrB/MazE fold protein
MTQTIEAIFQDGMFKPLNPFSEEIAEGRRVKLVVETDSESEEENLIMKLAENFYEGLSDNDVEEMERIMLDRSNFFGERTNKIEELLEGITEENIQEAIDFQMSVAKEITE